MAKKEKNVVKFNNRMHINIGLIIFLFIIVYVFFSIILYLSDKPVAEYEVTQGTITTNHVYKGLVIRDESLVTADVSGDINYYIVNGAKVGVKDVICSIDTVGSISKQIREQADSSDALSANDMSGISSDLSNYIQDYNPNYFQITSAYKEELSSKLTQSLNTAALNNLESVVGVAINANTFFKISSSTPGTVSYNYDGMENLLATGYSADDFNMSNYARQSLESNQSVSKGDPIYRFVNSEEWHLIVPVSADTAMDLEEKSVLKIKFCKDNYTTAANFVIEKKANKYYLNFTLDKAMIRYINDRYLDIELVLSKQTGLKIPLSAITEKEFFKIPVEFIEKGGDSSTEGFLVESDDDSKDSYKFVAATIYYRTDEYCYIDSEFIHEGQTVIKADSLKTYVVGTEVDKLQGVYNINKGYAVFKQINILMKNEDYAIVETKTDYGIALYDHIALDGSKIVENQTIKK